jgi:integrase
MALRSAAVAWLRRAELAALRWDDLDRDRLTVDSSAVVVRVGGASPRVFDAPTKTANSRTVRLDSQTASQLVALRKGRDDAPYVFTLEEGPAKPDRIGWWWRRARQLSGIDEKWRLHDLRHWSAITSFAGGTDVRTVAGRLGHPNAAMTLRVYAHALEGADQTVADALGGLLDDTPSP